MKIFRRFLPLITLQFVICHNLIPSSVFAEIDAPAPVVVQDGNAVSNNNQLPQAVVQEDVEFVNIGEGGEEDQEHNLFVKTLLYLPNRVFDILDIVRFRVRLGPGVAAGARVTQYVSANLGAYMTTYVGLPGPRQKRQIPRPVGFESYAGGSLSVLNYETEIFHPEYSVSEIGAQGQVLLVGLDAGIDPWEIVDLLGGFVGFDPRDDDL